MTINAESKKDSPKVDRRILRTRQALRYALLSLIKEKGFDAISVEEITEKANLGRATFYLHYRDIATNRVQVLSEIPVEIWRSSQGNLESKNGLTPIMPLLLVFEHAGQNADLYRILFKGQSSERIAGQLREIIIQSINVIITTRKQNESHSTQMEVPVELLAAYFSGALMSSIKWWLEQESPPKADEMASMFQHLFFPGVMKIWIP
jgi:AcrR family transcriptional regulator